MARVIGIVSGKGGVGKTTFAANLGIALSKFNKKVVIIDCNISTPHLAYYLGVKSYSATLNNVLKGEIPIHYAPIYYNEVMLIPASEELKDLIRVDVDKLKEVIEELDKFGNYDYILLDSAPGLGREALSVLQTAKEIIFVTTPTIPTVADVTRCAELASKLGNKRFYIVLNMVRGRDYELAYENAENFFHSYVLGKIPFSQEIMDSTALGIPFLLYKPNSPIAESFMEIAANLIGIEYRKKESILEKLKKLFKR
ncbi:MAG: septum site-determining protein MinD [Candidatus Aenigmatarchaeota archaeon]|nr:MAG: septum site-determining protein MinD [Candidatus Aenigmarchaeota archaeon]